jgi:TPR repeat protein
LVGDCYALGRGVSQNDAKAFKWYQKAATEGFAEAQTALGNCYLLGRGVAKNEAEAVKWLQRGEANRTSKRAKLS